MKVPDVGADDILDDSFRSYIKYNFSMGIDVELMDTMIDNHFNDYKNDIYFNPISLDALTLDFNKKGYLTFEVTYLNI